MRITIKLILILALMSTPALAANLFVPGQYLTIQDAVDAASPGDRILVAAGDDYAGARIDKSVKISGEGDATVITKEGFRQLGQFPIGFYIVSDADKTEISDLTIALSVPDELPDDTSLTGIENAAFAGPSAIKGSVRNVRFVGLTRGIRIRDSSKWIIMDNTVAGLKAGSGLLATGIWLSGTGNSMVANNTIVHNAAGVPGKIYVGINLSAGPGTGHVDNNKLVNNTVSVYAPGARKYNDIELFQTPDECTDSLFVVANKIISNTASGLLLTPECLANHNVVH